VVGLNADELVAVDTYAAVALLPVSVAIGFIALFRRAVLHGVVVVTCRSQLRAQAVPCAGHGSLRADDVLWAGTGWRF